MNRNILAVPATAILTAIAITAGPAAIAGTSHVLGQGGTPPTLDSKCRRAQVSVADAPGLKVLRQYVNTGFNQYQAQIKCLIHRKATADQCIRSLGVVPEVAIVKKDDWTGVQELRDYVASLEACVVDGR